MNRFIQFNDETIDTNSFLLYERLARALADANYLKLTERKLFEFKPEAGVVSMSVFWRHRTEEVMHKGRLSDVYLLTVGFWKSFNIEAWHNFIKESTYHSLSKFARQLLLLLEEFRLIDDIVKERPGTAHAFQTRREAYTAFHHNAVHANMQKNMLADGLLSEIFIVLHNGLFVSSSVEWEAINIERIYQLLENVYEAKSTADNAAITWRILAIVKQSIKQDLFHQYYSVADRISEESTFNASHKGMTDAEKGEEERNNTIEEVFRSWHAATEDEEGIHLQYELEHGRSGKADAAASLPGDENGEIEEINFGSSVGDEKKQLDDESDRKMETNEKVKQAGVNFGKAHINVVYEERYIEIVNEHENRQQLVDWREEQKPYVRSFVEEMKKRIELKKESKRERLMAGRLSSKLTTLVLDERPKPFYRKNAPSVQLDAVFGLLVDGSASMIDKLDETKKAVLLFHDVLRELRIRHEISSYYEDSYNASANVQPNYFEQMHMFQDLDKDNALSILSFDANDDNRDGFAIRWMAKKLMVRQEKHKFLLVFSDGEPSAFGYDRNGILDTAEAVMETEKNGITVIHLFLSSEPSSVEQQQFFSLMFGNKTASSSSVEDFAEQTMRILRKSLALVIRNG